MPDVYIIPISNQLYKTRGNAIGSNESNDNMRSLNLPRQPELIGYESCYVRINRLLITYLKYCKILRKITVSLKLTSLQDYSSEV